MLYVKLGEFTLFSLLYNKLYKNLYITYIIYINYVILNMDILSSLKELCQIIELLYNIDYTTTLL
jgi:hypothetical protein